MKHTMSILTLGALLLLTSCAADVVSPSKKGTHEIRYSVTVNSAGDDSPTRASINADKNYVYAAGDMLFIRSTGADEGKVYGALTLDPQDNGKLSGVTFNGTLTVVDGFVTQDNTPLEAVLVGSEAQLYTFNPAGNQLTSGPIWPTDGVLCTSVAQAVERYSILTAQSTYGEQSFNLSQGSCFVNFSVTLNDGTAAGEDIGAYVWTDNNVPDPPTDMRSGTVTTVADGTDIKANFVAAFPAGTVLDGAVVGLGARSAIAFGGTNKTLEANKIYNVRKTFTRTAATISFNQTSLVKSNPDQPFTNPLTNTGQGNETVTYVSSDPTVATVVASGDNAGRVTIVGAGTTRITATVQDGVNYAYSEHDAYYDLTVYDPVLLADATASQLGWVIATDGKAYVTTSGINAAVPVQSPVAIIGYVGAAGTADASSATYRGLAIALNDAATSAAWSDDVNLVCTTNPCGQLDFPAIVASMAGIDNTTRMTTTTVGPSSCHSGTSDTHTHAAALAASGYGVDVSGYTWCSNWFLPTTGQWFKVFEACGVATGQWTGLGDCPDSNGLTIGDTGNQCADNYTAIQRLMTAAGGTLSEYYWTSTERSSGTRFAFFVSFGSDYGVNMHFYSKSVPYNVRPFIAF